MGKKVIEAEGLSKLYRYGPVGPQSIREVADQIWNRIRPRGFFPKNQEETLKPVGRSGRGWNTFWALRELSFHVQDGEILGIIGKNGSGKSTLLKLISKITSPTSGKLVLRGRVAAILEVGTGFHPELSGRDNIFVNGAMLGMKRCEIRKRFDQIVEFAGVGPFLDTPVKRYSSGMYVRLAFAVAAHLEPDILVVDEVLAVGDLAFQRKCLGRMSEVAKGNRTVLFVSHNLLAVQSLCSRVIWLNDGEIVSEGPAAKVVSQYIAASASVASERLWRDPHSAPCGNGIRLKRIAVRPENDHPDTLLDITTPFRVDVEYENDAAAGWPIVGIRLFNEQEILVFDLTPPLEATRRPGLSSKGQLRTTVHVPGRLLNSGIYRVMLLIHVDQAPVVELPDALLFNLADTDEERGGWYGAWPGVLRPTFDWETNLPSLPGEIPSADSEGQTW